MSSKNRVNPDHYQQAGPDPQGEALNAPDQKQILERERAARPSIRPANFIPGGDRAPGQKAAKVGMVASSQKTATSHSGTRSMAATRRVPGAFGREGAGKATPARRRAGSGGRRRTGKTVAAAGARRKTAKKSRGPRRR